MARAAGGAQPSPLITLSVDGSGARAVDLVPRQSALNVNEVHDKVAGIRLGAAFAWLTGFGAKSSYERQRENFEQFVFQDIFASGFGKGSTKFGWTFGPNPGMKRIAPGMRTTFAALVLPREAVSLELKMKGCAYERKAIEPPACTAESVVTQRIPRDQEGFWVKAIRYTPVRVGEMATVFLSGGHFSPQVSVLVNGFPLLSRNRLGANTTPAGGAGVQGDYEYVNQELVVLRFSMGADFAGTPRIALLTPQKADDINRFNVEINGVANASLTCSATERASGRCADAMFHSRTLRELRIVTMAPVTGDPNNAQVRAHVLGTGFQRGDKLDVNGTAATLNAPSDEPQFHDITFVAPQGDEWTVRLVPGDGGPAQRLQLKNPLLMKRDGDAKAQFVASAGGQPARALITLKGGPFNAALDQVMANGRPITDPLISSGEIALEVPNPPAAFSVFVRRQGTRNGLSWTVVKPEDKPKQAAPAGGQ